jgi:hypothetical protein
MSSPKRAAKTGPKTAVRTSAKRNGKIAPRRRPDPSPPAKPAGNGASVDAQRLAATLERGIADGKLDLVSADALQKLIAAACRVYSARTEAGEQFTPVPKHSISATDVMLTASGLLRAADLAVFELGMWQSWTGR